MGVVTSTLKGIVFIFSVEFAKKELAKKLCGRIERNDDDLVNSKREQQAKPAVQLYGKKAKAIGLGGAKKALQAHEEADDFADDFDKFSDVWAYDMYSTEIDEDPADNFKEYDSN
jgi:hypothetical protein